MPKTDTKERVLEFILAHPLKNGSSDPMRWTMSPTLNEIAAHLNMTKGTVQYHLEQLKAEGRVDWTPRITRTLRAL